MALHKDKPLPSLVVAGILDDAPQKEVVESKSGADAEPAKAPNFIFEVNTEGELSVEAPVEHLPEQISKSKY